jgi:hypothetical protein
MPKNAEISQIFEIEVIIEIIEVEIIVIIVLFFNDLGLL